MRRLTVFDAELAIIRQEPVAPGPLAIRIGFRREVAGEVDVDGLVGQGAQFRNRVGGEFGDISAQPSEPRPPAEQTEAASVAVVKPAIGASTTGCSILKRSVRCRSGHIVLLLPVPRLRTAIDVQDLAGDICGSLKIQDRVDDFLNLPHSPHRLQTGEEFIRLGLMHRRLDRAGRDGVHANAPAGVFDCKRSGDGIEGAFGHGGKRRGKRRQRLLGDSRRDVDDVPGARFSSICAATFFREM